MSSTTFIRRHFLRSALYLSSLLLLLTAGLSWSPGLTTHAYRRPANTALEAVDVSQASDELKTYSISPAKLELGKEYEVVIYTADCQNTDLTNSRLVALQGSGIIVLGTQTPSKCSLTTKVRVEADASLGKYQLLLKGKKKTDNTIDENITVGLAEVEKTAIAPGPIPPGLEPEVDLMWGVMDNKVVHDNFGHDIANGFYGIQMVIGNNSGFDLQIAGVGFRLPNPKLKHTIVPTNSYRSTRGVLEREQEFGRRSIILSSIKASGMLFTGFLPFWRVAHPRANAATWADLINGPLVAGFEQIVPDTTVRQLVRLDDQMLRDGMIVKNNSQTRTLVFVPKSLINLPKKIGTAKDSAQAKSDTQATPSKSGTQAVPYQRPIAANGAKSNWSIDPQYVMEHLGELVLVGQCVQYLNRVQVIARPDGAVTPPPTITGVSTSLQQGVKTPVAFTGTNLSGAIVTAPDGFTITSSANKADDNGNSLFLAIEVTEDVLPGEYPLAFTTKAGASLKTIKVDPAKPDDKPIISYSPSQPTADKATEQPVTVTLNGKGLRTAKIVEPLLEATAKQITLKSNLTRKTGGGVEFKIVVNKNAPKGEYEFALDNHGEKSSFKLEVKAAP